MNHKMKTISFSVLFLLGLATSLHGENRSYQPWQSELPLNKNGMASWYQWPLPTDVVEALNKGAVDLSLWDGDQSKPFWLSPTANAQKIEESRIEKKPVKVISVNRETLSSSDQKLATKEEIKIQIPVDAASIYETKLQIHLESAKSDFAKQLVIVSAYAEETSHSLYRIHDMETEQTSFTLPPATSEVTLIIKGEGTFLEPKIEYSRTPTKAVAASTPSLAIPASLWILSNNSVVFYRPAILRQAALVIQHTPSFYGDKVACELIALKASGERLWTWAHDIYSSEIGKPRVVASSKLVDADYYEYRCPDASTASMTAPFVDIHWSIPSPAVFFDSYNAERYMAYWGGPFNVDSVPIPTRPLSESGKSDAKPIVAQPKRGISQEEGFKTMDLKSLADKMGPAVDKRQYRYESSLSPLGDVMRLIVPPSEVMRLRPDWADIRVVNKELKSIPYLIRPFAVPQKLLLNAQLTGEPTAKDPQSTFTIKRDASLVPEEPLSLRDITRVYLSFQEKFFQRSYEARIKTPVKTMQQSGTFLKSNDEGPAPYISLPADWEEVTLSIHNQGNEPLLTPSVYTLLTVPEILILVRNEPMTMIYGRVDEQKPSYDLEAFGGWLWALPFTPQAMGFHAPNPNWNSSSVIPTSYKNWILWSVVGLAVVALLGMTFRLLKEDENKLRD